jgi:hypothetical protein
VALNQSGVIRRVTTSVWPGETGNRSRTAKASSLAQTHAASGTSRNTDTPGDYTPIRPDLTRSLLRRRSRHERAVASFTRAVVAMWQKIRECYPEEWVVLVEIDWANGFASTGFAIDYGCSSFMTASSATVPIT